MQLEITADSPAKLRQAGKAIDRGTQAAMHRSVDKATTLAQNRIQRRIKSVGLGRLSGAVGATSSEKKRRRAKDEAWGVIFARGGKDSRAGQALEIYTSGGSIRGRNVDWLAIATRALPKRVGRYRMTPKRYEAAGSPLGPLVFKRLSANRAILIAQGDFTVSAKTGRARHFKGRVTRSRVRQRDVVAFVLIRETRRAKRFDHRDDVRRASSLVPRLMERDLAAQALPGVGP